MESFTWDIDGRLYHAVREGEPPAELVMLHANGFNGGTYGPLLKQLSRRWVAPDFRGHGGSFQPETIRNWNDFLDDIRGWEATGLFANPVAIGHSLGGVLALLTEAARPGTFRAIALLDPVIFAPHYMAPLAFAQLPGIRNGHPLVRATMGRRMEFPDRESILASYESKPAFRTWKREFLEAYVHWGTVPTDNGVRLACDRHIEARIFTTWPVSFWTRVRRVRCPVLILRGARSDTFLRNAAAALEKRLPKARLIEMQGAGHFLPMEQPEAVASILRQWLDGDCALDLPFTLP